MNADAMRDITEQRRSVALSAALSDGDRWLSPLASALHLGMMDATGNVKLRSFLALADKPGFPIPLEIGKNRMWRKSELDTWAEEQRRVQR